jgi:prolyl oligopeptidase
MPSALRLSAALTLTVAALMTHAQSTALPIHGDNGITLPAPPVATVNVVTDDYNGIKVQDPYRWLEDAKSPATRAWINQENTYTRQYLDQLKTLPKTAAQLAALMRVDHYSQPILRSGKYFFKKQLASENQGSIYVRNGWTGQDQRLIDATTLSTDQNTSVGILDVSDDGNLLVYEIREGGADEGFIHIRKVKSNTDLPDVLPSARYMGVALAAGNSGLYYAKFTHQGSNVWLHTFGTPVNDDTVVFGGEYRGQHLGELDLINVNVTDNHHYLIVDIAHGVPATSEDYLVKDLRDAASSFVPVVYKVQAHVRLLDAGDRFFLMTDYEAPNTRIVEAFPGGDASGWKTIVPEGKEVIDDCSIVGNQLFVSHLHDVKPQTTIYTLDGQQVGTLRYPGIGTGSVPRGRPGQTQGFYTFESFTIPPRIYRYDTKTGQSDVFAAPKVPFNSDQYEVTQVFYTSKDGTRVPMFVAGKKGLPRDGQTRLLMTGYGGFDLPMLSEWNPEYAWWMQQGGYFALPNLRGGNEYGEAWHKAAMFENKQNVFDDFAAAARYLIDNKYTSPAHLAIEGGSNGGLLMGAAMTQHPELYRAVVSHVGIYDMLRVELSPNGAFNVTEFGTVKEQDQFNALYAYSPYHHVRDGTQYPAVLFMTGANDPRVDPANSRKMTARLQASGTKLPVLLRTSSTSGHGIGSALSERLNQEADVEAFLFTQLSATR